MKISKYALTDQVGLQELKVPAQAVPLSVGLEDATPYLYALTLVESEVTAAMTPNAEADHRVYLAVVGDSVPLEAVHRTSRFLGVVGGKWAFWLGPTPSSGGPQA